jgi:hypothetical protein
VEVELEDETPELSRTEFLALKNKWKIECEKGKKKNKDTILYIANKVTAKTKKGKDYETVNKHLIGQLNKFFKTSYNL